MTADVDESNMGLAESTNDTRIEDRLSFPTDDEAQQHSGFHHSHPARIDVDQWVPWFSRPEGGHGVMEGAATGNR